MFMGLPVVSMGEKTEEGDVGEHDTVRLIRLFNHSSGTGVCTRALESKAAGMTRLGNN